MADSVFKKINSNKAPHEFISSIDFDKEAGDVVITYENDIDAFIWFTSNFIQCQYKEGNREVIVIHGNLVNSLADFISQINYTIPASGKYGARPDPLYDLLLCFETEPKYRLIFWLFPEHLLNVDRAAFEVIFNALVVAAFVNRSGISTVKENGENYLVDQRNIFVCEKEKVGLLQPYLDKEYYIPSSVDYVKSTTHKLFFSFYAVV